MDGPPLPVARPALALVLGVLAGLVGLVWVVQVLLGGEPDGRTAVTGDAGAKAGASDAVDQATAREDEPQAPACIDANLKPVRASPPPSRPLAPGEILIFDPRSEAEDGPPRRSRVHSVGPDEAKRVLARVFRGLPGYLGERSCAEAPPGSNDGATSLEAFEEDEATDPTGAFSPTLERALDGSFTAPNVSETLYSIFDGRCFAMRTGNTVTLAVFRQERLVARAKIGPTQHAAAEHAFDLDGDGQDELLITGAYGPWQGTFTIGAKVARFARGALVTVEDFGTVVEDYCTGAFCGAYSEATQIRAQTKRRSRPTFTFDRWITSCDAIR